MNAESKSPECRRFVLNQNSGKSPFSTIRMRFVWRCLAVFGRSVGGRSRIKCQFAIAHALISKSSATSRSPVAGARLSTTDNIVSERTDGRMYRRFIMQFSALSILILRVLRYIYGSIQGLCALCFCSRPLCARVPASHARASVSMELFANIRNGFGARNGSKFNMGVIAK